MPKVPGHAEVFIDTNTQNRQKTDAAAQTYKQGALLFLDGSGNTTECGADPAAIYALANGPAGLHPEGSTQTTVTELGSGQRVWMPVSSAPTKADNEGREYGVAKDADGIWVVDLTDIVNTRVYVHQVDEDTDMMLVSVLQAFRQIGP